jgi:plastocyanin
MPSLSLRTAALFVATVTGALVVGIASPAFAVTTDTSLITELGTGGVRTITLENDVTVTDNTITVDGTATLDLHGFQLTAHNISLAGGATLIVTNVGGGAGGALIATGAGLGLPGIALTNASVTLAGGTITATGGANQAGIGGGGNSGTILIDGATVTATGGTGGAGIGGSLATSGSNITISAGTVTANGGANAAGIGGGSAGAGFNITVSGGTVTANGGQGFASGAGIGGGYNGAAWNLTFSGGTTSAFGANNAAGIGTGEASPGTASGISIGAGAVVNATSGGGGSGSSGYPYPSAVGGSENNISNGAVTIAGTLNVFGHMRHNGYGAGAITIESTGVLGGTADIRGQNGAIVNHGAITAPNIVNAADTAGGLTITDHAYLVSFVAPGATPSGSSTRVYATSMAAGDRPLWADPVLTGWVLDGWADAVGAPFTTASAISGNMTVHALWSAGSIVSSVDHLELNPPSVTITAGDSVSFTAEGFDSSNVSLGDFTSSATWSSSDATAVITGPAFSFTKAGAHTITATVGGASATSTVNVTPATADDISFELSAASVKQGGSLTFEAWTVDAFGNRIANVSSSVAVTSDQPTDVITGTTVTFPHASPHVLTATFGAFSATATVQVLETLAVTGVNPTSALLAALLTLLLGGALLTLRRVELQR